MRASTATRLRLHRLGRVAAQEDGQSLLLFAAALVVLFAIAAIAIDVGRAYLLQRELQTMADAAALAGAQQLPNGATAISTAATFGAGGKNPVGGVTVTETPTLKCSARIGIACDATHPNAISVQEQATVPTMFAGVIGFKHMTVEVSSTASGTGGSPHPLDVMIVIDTTASMQSKCSSSVSGITSSGSLPTKLDCAKAGVRGLISTLWPCAENRSSCGTPDSTGNVSNPVDKVGLMVYPAITNPANASLATELDCVSNAPAVSYPSLPAAGYQVVPLVSDFRTSDRSGLNNSSNLVKAVYWGGVGCPPNGSWPTDNVYGVEDPGGAGTYFSDVITQAQTYLGSDGRNAQKAIILLSDGEANRGGPNNNPNPCHAAINASHAAAAQGTWVYAIAYDSSGSCSDQGTISALSTMQQIACSPTACPDSTKFFNQPTAGDLTTVFTQVAEDLTSARLIPDNTQ